MYPANFDYARPASIDEAIALLARHGDDAKVLAGGHSLIPAMKLRLARPALVVDIGRIAGLSSIREVDGRVAIGATTTHADVASSALLQRVCPLLPETAAVIGDAQVRNKGTIGGSLVHGDPAADYPASILALDAEIELAGPRGRRVVPATGFFVGLLQTAIDADEILVEVRLPITGRSVAYVKTEQKASGFALAGVAAVIGGDGVRVGVTGVAPVAYRAARVEQALAGRVSPPPDLIAAAAAHAADGIEPLSDIHASAEFRAHLAQVNARRAIERALQRA
jgi:carbon-monoxide dehydrogenase medium subunit